MVCSSLRRLVKVAPRVGKGRVDIDRFCVVVDCSIKISFGFLDDPTAAISIGKKRIEVYCPGIVFYCAIQISLQEEGDSPICIGFGQLAIYSDSLIEINRAPPSGFPIPGTQLHDRYMPQPDLDPVLWHA